jgi:hypothetical protein
VDGAKKVGSKLLLWRKITFFENHEFAPSQFDDVLDKLEPETAESVSVGNHNFEFISSHCPFQNGFNPLTLIAESTSDVFDDFCFWIVLSHELDSSFEVVSLFI